jgi:hypothetical protein
VIELPAGATSIARTSTSRLGRRGTAWWALLGYAVVALAFTLPAWEEPSKRWVGVWGDPEMFMNFLGWFPFAIRHGLNPLQDTYVNLPLGANLMWDTSVPLVAVIMWPVTALFGVVVSYNVAIVAALTMDGWCTFLWLRRHVSHRVAAWLAGLMMVLGPYVSTQTLAHLHLILLFPIPLLLLVIEEVARGDAAHNVRWGVTMGVLAAVQLLCAEELLALFVVIALSGFVIAAVVYWGRVASRLVPLIRVVAIAFVVFLVLAGVPLLYQLFGPGRIVGPIQAPNTYVTDAANLFVPNLFAALDPLFASHLAAQWTGGPVEADGYIGIPFILVAVVALLRWRRDRWLWLVGLSTAAAVVWGLGPYLHVNGLRFHSPPLPGLLLAHVPFLDDALPSRFALFTDLGLAAVAAVFIDRGVLLCQKLRWRAGAIALLIAVAATVAPRYPIQTWRDPTPAYFLERGDGRHVVEGTVALVVPYGEGGLTQDPLLWQAEGGFRIRMVSGAIYTSGPGGIPSFGRPGGVVGCSLGAIQADLQPSSCGADEVNAARSELDELGVKLVILGPMPAGTNAGVETHLREYLTALAGKPPMAEDGVLVWEWGVAAP